MPTRAPATCPAPGCDRGVPAGGACPDHPRRRRPATRAPDLRPSSTARGYDRKWARNRARFLAAHPVCTDCGAPATVADHAPLSRRELLARADPHPDAWHHLQPRCAPCHNRRTALTGR